MRNCASVLLAALAAVFISPLVLQAQQPPDLSGVWFMRSTPATRYLGSTFMAQTPPMTPWAVEKMKPNKPSFGPNGVADSNDPVNPTTGDTIGCFPPGVPRIYLHPFPMEIIQTPGRVLMVYEFNHFVRQIFTDGRKHSTAFGPKVVGHSQRKGGGDPPSPHPPRFKKKTGPPPPRPPPRQKLQ